MQNIIRTVYLDQINNLFEKQIIILLVGLRRVGKSTIMQQCIQQKHIKDSSILYVPLEQFDFLHIRKREDLIQYLRDHNIESIQYLCIDEIQLVSGREEVINGVYTSYPDINIILTGSNSDLLSTEIATGLRGRVYQIYVYPFDLAEYASLYKKKTDHNTLLALLQGTGLPLVYRFDDTAYMIQELVNTIFLKDIVERYTIRDVDLLRSIFSFIVSNAGNITNLAKIAAHLTQIGFNINLNTIGNYVEYLKNSLLVHECSLYDIQ